MIKHLGLIRRRSDLTREQSLKHWREVHGAQFLPVNVRGLRKYIQNHPVKVTGTEFDTDIDGIAELCFDDIESAQAFIQWQRYSDEAKVFRDDIKLFANIKESPVFTGEEYVLKE